MDDLDFLFLPDLDVFYSDAIGKLSMVAMEGFSRHNKTVEPSFCFLEDPFNDGWGLQQRQQLVPRNAASCHHTSPSLLIGGRS